MRIVISGGKGGTGKTMVASSIYYLLRKKYIAVDVDVDEPNLYLILGAKFSKEKEIYSNIAEGKSKKPCRCPFGAIQKEGGYYKVNKMLCEGCGFCEEFCDGFKLKRTVAGWVKEGLTRYGTKILAGFLKPGRSGSGKIVDEVIREALKYGENLLMDASAGIGCPVISSFKYADVALFVLEPTLQSFQAFKRIRKVAEHFGLEWYVILNKANLGDIRYPNTILQIPHDIRILKSILDLRPPTERIKDIRKEFKEALSEIGLL